MTFKLLIKRIISESIYYSFIKTNFYIPRGVRVLCYHDIKGAYPDDFYTVAVEEFQKQMDFIAREEYSVISLEDFVEIQQINKKYSKAVILTFDDGFKSFYRLAYPILREYRYPATLFLVTNFIHKGEEFLNWNEVDELHKEGLVNFGAHTSSHFMLTKISKDIALREIIESKKEIESRIGTKVQSFSYPYGAYNNFLKDLVKSLEFKIAVTDRFGSNSLAIDPFALRRITIFNSDSLLTFGKKLLGAYDWRGIFKKGWLNLRE
jgi:peptidoglycan/xylan/chitin deacetylase (PgdA/CDA1 family)